jgi:glycosyltransferase involved in cell wall biosynthesis
MDEKGKYEYTPLPEPIPISEQVWPADTLPLVHTRTMTYMHENYIRDCIEGILIQKTTFPVQVLIHDDASTDKTAKIVREYELKYPKLIKAYYQKENSYSQPDKFKRRAEFVKWRIGKYEAICEGDDYWTDPLKLQKQVKLIKHLFKSLEIALSCKIPEISQFL